MNYLFMGVEFCPKTARFFPKAAASSFNSKEQAGLVRELEMTPA